MAKQQPNSGTTPLDEFHGQGGSYVVNPDTGQRELVERTQDGGGTPAQATE